MADQAQEALVAELERLTEQRSLIEAEQNFPFFLKTYVWTQDEHDVRSPFKKFPDKPYLMEMAQVFVDNDAVAVEKSRQMMVTWLACAFSLWYTMFYPGRRTFIQSKKEHDANALVDRVKFIYERLPETMKSAHPANQPMSYLRLDFGKQSSIIQGLPQGDAQVRQYTASLIISDEAAFQDKAEEAYIAALPTLVGGGKYIAISSPNFKEFFYRVVQDEL